MFRRKGNSLPTTSPLDLPSGGLGSGFNSSMRTSDGSSKAIKIDAPVVKAWKRASGFTKGSYYILAFFFFLLFIGFKQLRYWNASIWLNCHAQECTLQLTPPGVGTKTVVFPRSQLVSALAVKVDKAGHFVTLDTDKWDQPNRKNGKNKKKGGGSYKGADEQGLYRTYGLKFKKSSGDEEKSEDDIPDGDFTPVLSYLEEAKEDGTYMLYMRQYGLAHSRTRVRSMINKVESYVRKRRQKLVVKENATLPWQGILCLIFGLLGIMLTLLIGQFWEAAPKKHGGPGVRRQSEKRQQPKKKENPKFFIDTGKPSKYPPGYSPGNKKH
jgi:hypothetical protein